MAFTGGPGVLEGFFYHEPARGGDFAGRKLGLPAGIGAAWSRDGAGERRHIAFTLPDSGYSITLEGGRTRAWHTAVTEEGR